LDEVGGLKERAGMNRQQVKDLMPGGRVDTTLAVIECVVRQDKNGNDYLTLILADCTDRVAAVRFSPEAREFDGIGRWRFVHVAGAVDQYNGNRQIKVDRPLTEADTPENLAEFMPASPYPIAGLRDRLNAHIGSIREPNLRALLREIFETDQSLRRNFEDAPAAKGNHHAFVHGLLQHTLEVTDLAAAVADVQNGWGLKPVSRDLAVTGALLHDIGKVHELSWSSPAFDYTSRGSLLGHIMIGSQLVTKYINRVRQDKAAPFPQPLQDALLHIMLSHHGRGEFGSPIPPMFPEAQIVSTADLLDVQLFYMDEAANKAADHKNTEWSTKLEGSPRSAGRQVFTGGLGLMPPAWPTFEETTAEAPAEPTAHMVPILRFVLSSDVDAELPSFDTRCLPLIGRVAAGLPILADDHIEDMIDVEDPNPSSDWEGFLLRVQGDSMIGDGILEGDLITVRRQEKAEPGDIVVALIDDEATVKRLHVSPTGEVRLLPSNPAHSAIVVPDPDNLAIRGKVIGVLR
jgi:3'-5' exoribonuclease